jgi:DNA recombination protein RmuC
MNLAVVLIIAFLILVAIVAVIWALTRSNRGGAIEKDLRERLGRTEAELAQSGAQRLRAEKELSAALAVVAAGEKRVADLKTSHEAQLLELRQSHGAQLEEIRAGHAAQFAQFKEEQARQLAQMREAFGALGAETLAKVQPQFLELAAETFSKHAAAARGDLEKRQESIATLLAPLQESLKAYQTRLNETDTTHTAAIAEMRKMLDTLSQQSANLGGETQQLRMVLRSNTARGTWGEQTLRRTVEVAGMSVHCDFCEQVSSDDKKPDMIVRLPGDRIIIVDSKALDFEFLGALNEADETKRRAALKAHADKLRATVKALADRDYPSQFPNALDQVVLFLPAESLFSAALEGDSDLMTWAASRRIMLATPTSLIALLRSVAITWQQSDQAANAREIASAAEELYSRVATLMKHFAAIRNGLAAASNAYNDAVGSFERSVRPQGARVLELGVNSSGKELPGIDPVPEGLRIAPASQP